MKSLQSHQLIEDCLSFHVRLQLCCKQKQKLLKFERHWYVNFTNKKVHNFNRDLLAKIFTGKKANLVKFICFVKYFLSVFAADFEFEGKRSTYPRLFYYCGCQSYILKLQMFTNNLWNSWQKGKKFQENPFRAIKFKVIRWIVKCGTNRLCARFYSPFGYLGQWIAAKQHVC